MSDVAHWNRAVSLLVIDPGARSGWCLLIDVGGGWHIAGAGVVSPSQPDFLPVPRVDLLVIEHPKIYPNGDAKPDSILKLARIVGRYEERYGSRAKRVQFPLPREWKGTVDGDIMARRIEAGLSAGDRVTLTNLGVLALPWTTRHNALDAIGIAYWSTRQPWIKEPKAA